MESEKKGNKTVAVSVFGADGMPATSLPFDNSRTMSTFTMVINFNSDEIATSVDSGGKNYSIADLNKSFTELDAGSDVSTNK